MFSIIGKRYSPDEFDRYMEAFQLGTTSFKPVQVVLHNTSAPTLAQRPYGFTQQNMADLQHYYAVEKDPPWSGGPHLFVDDNGIWIFNPLDRAGVHSPSWNKNSWSIEMLGEYSEEPFASGRGAKVRDNAVRAAAAMCRKLGISAKSIRFHKEDPETTHKDCPGVYVVKSDFVARVDAALQQPVPPKTTVVFTGDTVPPREVSDGATDEIRYVAERLGAKVTWDGPARRITITPPK